MKHKAINDVCDEVRLCINVNEKSIDTARRRSYFPPKITPLNDLNVQSGTTTKLIETSGGVWNAGS